MNKLAVRSGFRRITFRLSEPLRATSQLASSRARDGQTGTKKRLKGIQSPHAYKTKTTLAR
ncbi:MAG: hypothetical protein ACRD21_20815, partial [Vicinamibacteria bacterium]